jgi:hypothetical protein
MSASKTRESKQDECVCVVSMSIFWFYYCATVLQNVIKEYYMKGT